MTPSQPETRDSSTDQQLFNAAANVIPGGVNSPVRAFKSVGGTPVFISRAKGPFLYDSNDQALIDYVGSWGPMIHGHAHPDVIRAVQAAAEHGLSYGAPTALETELAEFVCQLVPSIEKIRFVSSGTEATMTAIRLARGFTGRDKFIKFEGHYHGHGDSLLVKAGSGPLTLGVPTSPGVPKDLTQHTLTLDFNDLDQVAAAFEQYPEQIACIIVEPIAGNMNCVPAVPGYLAGLKKLCDAHGALLIFDEVMTGFRVAKGGAQEIYAVQPDLTTYGKIIGGGMPVGALGGRADVMEYLAPTGPVYQAGTLSGNPLAMTAGLMTLQLLDAPGFYDTLSQHTEQLVNGLQNAANTAGIALTTQAVGGMFGLFFTSEETVTSFAQVTACDIERFKQFFHAMLAQGVYLAPSAYEAGFVSAAHTSKEIEQTITAAEQAFTDIAAQR